MQKKTIYINLTMKILVIHGPNLQLLGVREPEIYGRAGLAEINKSLLAVATALGCDLDFFQTNHEGDIVDRIALAYKDGVDGIIINPAAYTHTSIAIRDALKAVNLPAVEVHLSNVSAREEFRNVSMTAASCVAVVAGFGPDSYELALRGLIKKLVS